MCVGARFKAAAFTEIIITVYAHARVINPETIAALKPTAPTQN